MSSEADDPRDPSSTDPEADLLAGRVDAGVEVTAPSGGESGASQPVEPAREDTGRSGVPFGRVALGCVAAWAFPGLGHVLLGRRARGLVFGLLILSLFVGGLWLDGKVYRPVEDEPLTYLAALGAAGVGAPFLIAHGRGWAEGDITSPYHEYGNTFTLVAGLLNLLIVLDAFDVAAGRR